MCGRFTRHQPPEKIIKRFNVQLIKEAKIPRYNIAPSQVVPVIRQVDEREMIACKWGLVPFWAKDPSIGNKMINAKAETLAEKPSFKQALIKRRCLIPADGFYEWQKKGKGASQPFYITLRNGDLFAFAGLWEEWKSPDGNLLKTFTVITVEPNELVSTIHNRMPAILKPQDEADWLNLKNRPADIVHILQPYPAEEMQAVPVSRMVNSPSYDDASCMTPIESPES
jgi:putative SOS response-associated peptidase YedK